jgi:hypothetical protein
LALVWGLDHGFLKTFGRSIKKWTLHDENGFRCGKVEGNKEKGGNITTCTTWSWKNEIQ